MSPVLRIVLAESTDLLVSTCKMTIFVAMFTFTLIFLGWLFSSGLPYRAIMIINGR